MRRFNWRRFRRKGSKKLLSKDERALESNVEKLKVEALRSPEGIREISKEVLPEEE
jgi:hypothetical protein